MYLLPSKIHDFEGFIAGIAKQKNLFSEQDIGKTTIKIATTEKDKVNEQIQSEEMKLKVEKTRIFK